MLRSLLAAAALCAFLPTAALAQTVSQEQLDARYDRALAAGYRALFLCGAIAGAERNGATRSVESVERWELSGIQAPLDSLIGEMRARPIRIQSVASDGSPAQGALAAFTVEWAEGFAPRLAVNTGEDGCRLAPIGMDVGTALAAGEPELRDLDRTASDQSVGEDGLARTGMEARYGQDTRTTAVVVMRSGSLVSEAYAEDFGPLIPQRTWSVAKSLAATIIGAGVERGEADVQAQAGLGLSASDPRSRITIDHLLRMASGRYSDTPGNRTDPLYFGGATVEESALAWPLLDRPGTVYRYANNDTLAAVRAIEPTFADHPPADLFARIGMEHTVAETDWAGDYILSSQVWSTARDLAKLGQLYLDGGALPDGTRILPEGWVDYVAAPSGPQPDGPFGYGAGFWLMNRSDGVPADTFAAFGNRGQYVVIVPSRNVVIVRRGEDPVGARFDIAAFTRDVLAALD